MRSREHATRFSLHSRRNYLYSQLRHLPAKPLHQTHQLHQVLNAEQGSTSGQRHYRIFRHNIGPTGGNRSQVITLLVEIDPVLAPGMQVGDNIELLAGPRVKGMSYFETSAQTVRINRS
jgi:hypothetical protein